MARFIVRPDTRVLSGEMRFSTQWSIPAILSAVPAHFPPQSDISSKSVNKLKGRRQRNLRPLCFWGVCIDLRSALELEGHPPIGVDDHHVNNTQPERFVKKDHRNSIKITVVLWWRRGELNPRPKTLPQEPLRAQTVVSIPSP